MLLITMKIKCNEMKFEISTNYINADRAPHSKSQLTHVYIERLLYVFIYFSNLHTKLLALCSTAFSLFRTTKYRVDRNESSSINKNK